MNISLVRPFAEAAVEVFHTMLGCQITEGPTKLIDRFHKHHDVSGIISLSGKQSITVVVSLDRDVATQMTSRFLCSETTTIDHDVIDAVGELTNMIAGGGKSALSSVISSMTQPTVIVGRELNLGFNKNTEPVQISFNCEWGDFSLELGTLMVPAMT